MHWIRDKSSTIFDTRVTIEDIDQVKHYVKENGMTCCECGEEFYNEELDNLI